MKSKAAVLAKLHHAPPILVLPNAWDAASARLFEDAGFPAIATTSAGIAWSLGHADKQKLGRAEMADAVARIARAVRIPVSADVEAGYGDVAATVNAMIDAGAVGMNLEDATHHAGKPMFPVDEQKDRIREARRAAEARKIPLVINARTDLFLLAADPGAEPVYEAIELLNAYREAGADCLFAPGIADRLRIEALAKALRGPLNVLAGAGTPSVAELELMGVARLSIGSGAMRASMALTQRIAIELRGAGTYAQLTEHTLPYSDADDLMNRRD
ncbi:MAG: isocitrate lyase/phosphoenolpyruvate mutase family protein [Planctomycetaceae bacterium]|nr:isocitrate lyase/phosphoenolpyruvate mutase family protein [Planctomycetaceae bacterium]